MRRALPRPLSHFGTNPKMVPKGRGKAPASGGGLACSTGLPPHTPLRARCPGPHFLSPQGGARSKRYNAVHGGNGAPTPWIAETVWCGSFWMREALRRTFPLSADSLERDGKIEFLKKGIDGGFGISYNPASPARGGQRKRGSPELGGLRKRGRAI